MKSILLNLILLFGPNGIPLDSLGKHIDDFLKKYTEENSISHASQIYTINVQGQFLGKSYTNIFVITNEDGIIENLTIYIDEIIDKSFYELMIQQNGIPHKLYKTGDIIRKGEEVIHKDGFTLKSNHYTFKECTFEESPRFIIWKKEKYDIEVTLGSERDTFKKTRITFGKSLLNAYLNKD